MLGAITGDIVGSVYELNNTKSTDFPLFHPDARFTDDTVCTVAVADAILHGGDYARSLRKFHARHPRAGFGGMFKQWARSETMGPYNSFGNGSAMRASPCGWAHDTLDAVLSEAAASASVTHNHAEGVKGAQATAAAVFLGRTGSSKEDIRTYVEETFGYDLSQPVDKLRSYYTFDVSCQGTVPQAMIAFLASRNYEDALRIGISLGGDSDTIGAITGGIAEAFYEGVPKDIASRALSYLTEDLSKVYEEFADKYVSRKL